MLARGDTKTKIHETTGIPIASISNIKKRNPEALAVIEQRILDHNTIKAQELLDKANNIIEQKLDNVAEGLEKSSLTELTSVSREMHSQAKQGAESEKTSPNPQSTEDQLKSIVRALEKGDEIELLKITTKTRDVIEQ